MYFFLYVCIPSPVYLYVRMTKMEETQTLCVCATKEDAVTQVLLQLFGNVYSRILQLKLGELIYISLTTRRHIALQIGCHPALHPLEELPIHWPAVSFSEEQPAGGWETTSQLSRTSFKTKYNLCSTVLLLQGSCVFAWNEREKISLTLAQFNETDRMTDIFSCLQIL